MGLRVAEVIVVSFLSGLGCSPHRLFHDGGN